DMRAGDFLRFDFDQSGGPNEGTYASNDSGGPVFALDPQDGLWKLAGIPHSVLARLDAAEHGAFPSSAILHVRGMSYGDATFGVQLDGDEPLGAYSLATRIGSADRLAVLNQFAPTAIPEPGSLVLLGVGLLGALAAGRARRGRQAVGETCR